MGSKFLNWSNGIKTFHFLYIRTEQSENGGNESLLSGIAGSRVRAMNLIFFLSMQKNFFLS